MMEPLKGRLADLVASERGAVVPPQDAKTRHWAAVSAAFGPTGVPPGGGTPGGEGAAPAAAAAKGGALLKVVGGTVLAAAVATAAWASRPGDDRPIASAEVAAPSERPTPPRDDDAPAVQAVAAPEPEPEPEPEDSPSVVEPASGDPPATSASASGPSDPSDDEPAATSRRRKPAPAPPVREAEPRGLAEEIALVESLRRAVVRGDHATAKVLAARHGREFPDGALVPDRLDLQATAHCASGDRDRGQTLAKELVRRFPEAPVSDRLTQACAAEDDP